MRNIKIIFNYTKDRKWYINLLWCLFCVLGVILIPTVFNLLFREFIKDKYVCSILGDLLFIIIMVLVYYKDLIKELDVFKRDFRKNIGKMIGYYIIGSMLMIGFNLILHKYLKDISLNENQVRELLFNKTTYMLFNIVVLAPVMEELAYRKSLATIIKNKWVYAIISGILFGSAHIMINVFSGSFIINDLLYILPYGSFGFMFAIMDYETKNTYSSIMMHSIHNLLNGLLLINLHMLGVL